MELKKTKPKISLKIKSKSQVIKKISTRKIKRIYHFLKAGNFKNCLFDVCVTYQKGVTNKGVYKTEDELIYALKCFLENGLWI